MQLPENQFVKGKQSRIDSEFVPLFSDLKHAVGVLFPEGIECGVLRQTNPTCYKL